jgi:tetratricopeptide (TPR) repeat protein
MSELPAAVGGLNKLELLYLSGNELSQLPDTITRLSALKDLDVAGNNLMYLPERLGSLQHLISLDLGNNPLRHLPASAARLKQLEFLNMGETHLAELPVEVLKMTSLTELNLSRNQLTRLPEEIRNLAQLRILDLSYNPLSKATLTTIRAQLPWCEVRFDTSQNKRGQDRAAYVYSPEKRHLTTYRDQEQVVKQYPDYYIEWFKLSWDALLAGEYERAVTAAHKTLELNPAAVMVETNLALGYLLSNHWPEAENIYLKWKGKQFPDDVMHRLCDDLFLKDIDDLQKAGITHPDLERVKALFKS